jgi:hypothetical protein
VTPSQDAGNTVGLAALGYPAGGCSTRGAQLAWLALPLLALLVLRRRKR